ncbi:hypothetical protein [Legionella longbeachae]|nr:hypothetical protein [Legionella longbeachae]
MFLISAPGFGDEPTGKAAWSTIWKGWFRLQERVEGLWIATELMKM